MRLRSAWTRDTAVRAWASVVLFRRTPRRQSRSTSAREQLVWRARASRRMKSSSSTRKETIRDFRFLAPPLVTWARRKRAPPPQRAMARWDEPHRPSARGATRKARSADSAPLREPHRLSRRARTEREVAPRGRCLRTRAGRERAVFMQPEERNRFVQSHLGRAHAPNPPPSRSPLRPGRAMGPVRSFGLGRGVCSPLGRDRVPRRRLFAGLLADGDHVENRIARY